MKCSHWARQCENVERCAVWYSLKVQTLGELPKEFCLVEHAF